MSLHIDVPASEDFFLSEDSTFHLGFKELLFLAFILFIGLCGFTVCVDKIYADSLTDEFQSITIHNKRVTSQLDPSLKSFGPSLN